MNKMFIIGTAFLLTQNSIAAINKEATKLVYKPQDIVVAVVDTGADIDHEELKNFIWNNEGETGLDQFGQNKETNQIDDDGNGFADDVHGWNFISNNNKVSDEIGHGTHIAGIIKNEFVKHSGIRALSSASVKLMILKYYDTNATNEQNLINSTRAIQYANKMSAQVINYSGGGGEPFTQELLAINDSAKKGILFVAAAGNNRSNMDVEKYYPASYRTANIISVAATDNRGDFAPFSNYGDSVDIAAPGKSIYSSLPNKKFGFMSGTSQSTAFVSGLAASLLVDHKKPVKKLIQEIKNLGSYNKTLVGKTKSRMALMADAN